MLVVVLPFTYIQLHKIYVRMSLVRETHVQYVILAFAFTSNQTKCHKYWEDEIAKPLQLSNGISVQKVEHKIFAEYQCRIFTVKHVSNFT